MLFRAASLGIGVMLVAAAGGEVRADVEGAGGFEASVARGRALIEAGDYAEARMELERARARAAEALLYIAHSYRLEGRLHEALAHYERLIDEHRRDDQIRREAARYAVAVRRSIEARSAEPPAGAAAALSFAVDEREPARDGRRRDRIIFWSAATATALGVAGTASVSRRLSHHQRTKDDLAGALSPEEQVALQEEGGFAGGAVDVCAGASAMVADGSATERIRGIDDSCRRGRRAVRMGNALAVASLSSAIVSGYFGYRGYLRREARKEPRIAPAAGPGEVGFAIDLRF